MKVAFRKRSAGAPHRPSPACTHSGKHRGRRSGSDAPVCTRLQKLSGTPNYYRIRVGDYRIGPALEDDMVVFVRCLHRKDIYRYFL